MIRSIGGVPASRYPVIEVSAILKIHANVDEDDDDIEMRRDGSQRCSEIMFARSVGEEVRRTYVLASRFGFENGKSVNLENDTATGNSLGSANMIRV